MEPFWKTVSFVWLSVILWLVLDKRDKDISSLLTLAVCCVVAASAAGYIRPVLELVWRLNDLGGLQEGTVGILLKVLGVGLITELAEMICADAGNSSMGRMLRLLGSAAVLFLSLPLLETLLTLIQEILNVL